jgi:WD40 repeat protein
LVEYVRALIPPTHVASFEHDDWVSSVDVLSATSEAAVWANSRIHIATESSRILSGSYDGLLRVWSTSSDLLAHSPSAADGGHTQPIKAAKFLSPSKIISAGNDRTIRLWNYSEESPDAAGQPSVSITSTLDLYGHRSSVDGISVHAPSSRILSASADHFVGVWSTKKSEGPSAPSSLLPSASSSAIKRRKLNPSSTSSTPPQRGPLSLLKGHTAPVSAVVFAAKDATVGYSTSWDHSIITWDLVTGSAVSTRRTLHPLLCISELPQLGLLATGTSARHIAMVDPRVDVRDVARLTLRGHTGAVSSVANEPNKPWGLVSGSLDGTCRIWDVRSVRVDTTSSAGLALGGGGQICQSIYVIRRESLGLEEKKRVGGDGVKVFTVCWDSDVGIISAGEDKKVQVNGTPSH